MKYLETMALSLTTDFFPGHGVGDYLAEIGELQRE